jgi:hypothetical protein
MPPLTLSLREPYHRATRRIRGAHARDKGFSRT